MRDRGISHVNKASATTGGANGAMTRRELMGASVLGAGLLGAAATPLAADAGGLHEGKSIIDAHVHLWKLPRSAPPMSDSATFPTGCCGSVPWMELDRLIPDYDARVGGPKVDNVVLIESSVGVTPDKIIQSNLWMLQTAAAEKKILSVVGNLDVTQASASFLQQLDSLAGNKTFVGLRIGGGIFVSGAPHTFANIQPNVLKNLSSMAQRGMMIDALGIPGAVLSQVGAATGITIVMDHFAGKPTTFDVEDAWKVDMQDAARYGNLNIKVSDVHKLSAFVVTGKPAGLTQFQPIADFKRYEAVLAFLWNTFGPDRLIFGTNWPVSDAGGLFVDSIDLEILILENFLSKQFSGGRDRVMFKNAVRVYSPRK